MSKTTHLSRRGDTFYFRARVPSELISAYGRAVVSVSLNTGDNHGSPDAITGLGYAQTGQVPIISVDQFIANSLKAAGVNTPSFMISCVDPFDISLIFSPTRNAPSNTRTRITTPT